MLLVRFLHRSAALAVISALSFAAVCSAKAQPPAVDSERLTIRLAEHGLTATEDLKALVVHIEEADNGQLRREYYDHAGTSDDRDTWWPSATMKIYAAVAALERLGELGFPVESWVTFEYADGPVTRRMDHIIRHALEYSSNSAFDRLVEFVGFDRMNTEFFTTGNGFEDTVMLRASTGRHPDAATENNLNRVSPRIVVRRGRRVRVIPAETGQGAYSCPDQGNCTSLLELAEAMSRIMLHDELPDTGRYDLRLEDLELLREALGVARNREVAQLMKDAFGDAPVEVHHRPGFGMRWASDVMFVHRIDTGERWVVALAARPGRANLNAAVRAIGAILAGGEL
ncbi:MAG: serine hydrolase [Deltaproteobacteria bacterium]|nr:serine hydrolase [Deltaproteobacteria bacterium]